MGIMSNVFGGTLSRLKDYGHSIGGSIGRLKSNVKEKVKSGFNKGMRIYNQMNDASHGRLRRMLIRGLHNTVKASKYIPGYGSTIHTVAKTIGKAIRDTTDSGTTWHTLGKAIAGKRHRRHHHRYYDSDGYSRYYDSGGYSKHHHRDRYSRHHYRDMYRVSSMKQNSAPTGSGLSSNNITATSR